jgi:hypothetical protein
MAIFPISVELSLKLPSQYGKFALTPSWGCLLLYQSSIFLKKYFCSSGVLVEKLLKNGSCNILSLPLLILSFIVGQLS